MQLLNIRIYSPHLTTQVTLLIAESVGSEKFRVAKELGIHIVRPAILKHLRSRYTTTEQYQSVYFSY